MGKVSSEQLLLNLKNTSQIQYDTNRDYLKSNGTYQKGTFWSRKWHCVHKKVCFKKHMMLDRYLKIFEKVSNDTNCTSEQLNVVIDFLMARGNELDEHARSNRKFRKEAQDLFNRIPALQQVSASFISLPEDKELDNKLYANGFLSGRLYCARGKLINPKGLSLAPTPITSLTEKLNPEERKAIRAIRLDKHEKRLEDLFDAMIKEAILDLKKTKGYRDASKDEQELQIFNLITQLKAPFISLQEIFGSMAKRKKLEKIKNLTEFYKELEFVLKALFYCTKGKSPNEQLDVWKIYSKTVVCPPTWLEDGKKILSELNGIAMERTFQDRLLEYVQRVKEDIIAHEWIDPLNSKERLQDADGWNTQWHHLNWMRKHCGQELGLDQNAGKFDGYADELTIGDNVYHFPYSKEAAIQMFLEDYTLEKLINEVLVQFELGKIKGDESEIQGALMTCSEIACMDDPESYITEKLFCEGVLTNDGIIVLLRSVGVLA